MTKPSNIELWAVEVILAVKTCVIVHGVLIRTRPSSVVLTHKTAKHLGPCVKVDVNM